MALPYSWRFLKATGIITPTYTVPAGYTVVVHQLTYVCSVAASICSAYFALPPGESFFHGVSDGNTPSWLEWQGRMVFNAGDSFQMACSNAAAMCAAGYRLLGP